VSGCLSVCLFVYLFVRLFSCRLDLDLDLEIALEYERGLWISPSSRLHLASRISHLASRISHLASRISHLPSRISHLPSRISHLTSRISHLVLRLVCLVILLPRCHRLTLQRSSSSSSSFVFGLSVLSRLIVSPKGRFQRREGCKSTGLAAQFRSGFTTLFISSPIAI
jgi:hypothetical protein